MERKKQRGPRPTWWENWLAAISGTAFLFAALLLSNQRGVPAWASVALLLVAVFWFWFEGVGRIFVERRPTRSKLNVARGILLVLSTLSLYLSLTTPWLETNREAFRSASAVIEALCEEGELPEQPSLVPGVTEDSIRSEWMKVSDSWREDACRLKLNPRQNLPREPRPKFTPNAESLDDWYCTLYVLPLYVCQMRVVEGDDTRWVLTQFRYVSANEL